MKKQRKRKNKLPEGKFIASIESLNHEGRGVAHVNGKATFIFNALPGETVEFDYTYSRKKFDCGKATTILSASTDRVTPRCNHFGICGGCSLQHVNVNAQISYKQNILLEQLRHFGAAKPENILPPLTASEYGYRHKARLGVRYVIKKETVLVGFREQQSNYLAQLSDCPVLHSSVGNLITPLRELIARLEAYQDIAQIEVAVAEPAPALVLRNLIELSANDKQILIEFAKQHDIWLYLQPGNADTVSKLYPNDEQLFLHYTLPEFNLTYQFHPLDFTQINPSINQKMVPLALSLLELKTTDKVLDLFCGLGNFTLPLAKIANHVVGVEGSEKMVERARMNAAHNAISNVEFFAADLMADCSNQAWAQQYYNKILLDPPRSGAFDILPLIANMKTNTIVYVSCNPATLARDAGELVNKYGYNLISVGVMDMFPHTAHVESIALFKK
jgi:23S rRNA (uracil1939-C5)-methyltransferase